MSEFRSPFSCETYQPHSIICVRFVFEVLFRFTN